MRYTVLWLPSAESRLITLWTESRNRQAISFATNEIDRALSTSPDLMGESRDDAERILFHAPLGVLYRILPAERKVEVISVWEFFRM